MRRIPMVMALAFVLGACSGSTTPATPAAVVPKDKIEVVDGWLRVKQYRLSNQNDSAQAVIGMSEIMVVSKTDSFMVPKADFRSNMKDDYWEIRMGATLKYEGVPKDHGFPVWDAALGSPQNMPACGGAATMCIAAWHGCGPMTCADGKIVGACCGGWSLAAPPK